VTPSGSDTQWKWHPVAPT